ncbi:hypothetical protein RHRU231_230054 [Rhodococcus ruber]|uniref:Uncharacterized protein n=1 Tax=Rhodococcus ruber TaxID=1830 RepID=A0A098BHM4_9NOCA|nr:hypothetical protein RHRU231_230054 [Rhodococcus ruber]
MALDLRRSDPNLRLHVITHLATLDVPGPLARYLGRLLQTACRVGAPAGSAGPTAFAQPVRVLCWFRQGVPLRACDAGIRIGTCYRHMYEGIAVLAAQVLELRNVLYARLAAGDAHVILDGTLISSGRVSETTVGAKVCTGVTTGRGSAAIAVARSSSPPRQQSARIDPPGVLFYSRIEYLGDDARVAAHGRAVVLTPPCELRMECSRYATLGSEVESVPASADLSAGTPSGRDGMI